LWIAFNDLPPGASARVSSPYKELNVFGTSTGNTIFVLEGGKKPAGPRGFGWRPLADRSVAELRARASRYRQMAETATTWQAMDGLQRLAVGFEELAGWREVSGLSAGSCQPRDAGRAFFS
jgi:hypothetical protein